MRAEEGDESIAELADYAEQAEQTLNESIGPLEGKKVAILATNGVERRELQEPRDAVRAVGASTELISLQEGSIDLRNHDLEPGGDEPVERLVADVTPDEFDALLIPGGTVNADKLRSDDKAVKFVHDFVESGKPVGVICHGPWMLIDAGVAKGRTLTSYPSIRIDLQNAGATVVDREVVVDGNVISSRHPDDLPAFCSAVVEAIAHSA
jgi:protease I